MLRDVQRNFLESQKTVVLHVFIHACIRPPSVVVSILDLVARNNIRHPSRSQSQAQTPLPPPSPHLPPNSPQAPYIIIHFGPSHLHLQHVYTFDPALSLSGHQKFQFEARNFFPGCCCCCRCHCCRYCCCFCRCRSKSTQLKSIPNNIILHINNTNIFPRPCGI